MKVMTMKDKEKLPCEWNDALANLGFVTWHSIEKHHSLEFVTEFKVLMLGKTCPILPQGMVVIYQDYEYLWEQILSK